jgi:asparagine synthase (glutamine-hydrolysing)
VAPVLPPSVLRRAKRGFSVPTDLWLRGPLDGEVDRLLAPKSLRPEGLFSPTAVADLVAAHRSGRRDLSQHLWALLAFQVWHRVFAEGSVPERLEEVG